MIVICFSHFDNSYAQSSEDNTTNNIILFVPQKMIVGESYHGMVTLLDPAQSSSLILLSVDDDFVLSVDSSVNIQTNKNHGTFKLTPLNEGDAIISILYDGELLYANTSVFSKKSDAQKLKVILPTNSTIATDMSGIVFLLDGNDSPIPSDFDRIISLIPSEKIFTPNSVTIQNGTSHATFPVIVRASGEITAIAPQLESHTISIEKSQEIIDVKIGIAPKIILEGSYTNYFIWLEKDGRPYTIQGVQKVEIQTSNTDVIRLGVSPASYKNENSIIISMNDGMAKGRLYTGERGIAEISVSIPNYGHVSSTVYVGATLLEGSDEEDVTLLEEYYDQSVFWTGELDINYIQFAVYPDVTDDFAYGVASLYHAEQTEEIEIIVDENGVQISNEIVQTVLVPVYTEDIQISISSQSGLKHNSSYLLDDVSFPTHSKIFEITANSVGNYTVIATGGNSYDTAPLAVTTDNNSLYSIHITELPILSHSTQPLLLISIINENGSLVDVSELFGRLFSVNLYSTNGKISASAVTFNDNVGIIYGIFTGTGTISVSSDNFGATSHNITPSGVAISMELLTPDIVHSGESFPIIIHEIDAKGTPISKKDVTTVSSSGFDVINGVIDNMISVSGVGEQDIAILSSLGGGYQIQIESFVNEIDYTVDVNNHTPRLGETVTIKITSQTKDITYNIDSAFPYQKIDATTFEITPDHTVNDSVITIIGALEGFGTTTKQVSISPVNLVNISVVAKTIHGDIISPQYTIKQIDSESTYATPHVQTISPQSIVVTLPKDWKTVSGGYKIVDLSINGKQTQGNTIEFYADIDYTIVAIYDRFVSVVIIDGEGSGVYSYGDKITISAPDKPILSFLVKETFDYWDTIDKPSSFVILAEKDMEVTAMYKDDYTILMGIILAGVIGVVVYIIKNGDNQFRYRFDDIAEKITPSIKRCIPNNNWTKIKMKKSKKITPLDS